MINLRCKRAKPRDHSTRKLESCVYLVEELLRVNSFNGKSQHAVSYLCSQSLPDQGDFQSSRTKRWATYCGGSTCRCGKRGELSSSKNYVKCLSAIAFPIQEVSRPINCARLSSLVKTRVMISAPILRYCSFSIIATPSTFLRLRSGLA